METEQKVKMLQTVYAAALADTVLRLGKEGVLDNVTADKRSEQMLTGAVRAKQFGMETPTDVFEKLRDTFACANWSMTQEGETLTAQASACMLCALAKRMGAPSPCRIYCLDAMEGMVKGLKPNVGFEVKETLYDGAKCHVVMD